MKVRMIAALLVDESGRDALVTAHGRLSELQQAGDRMGEQVWAQVLTIIEELLGTPSAASTLH